MKIKSFFQGETLEDFIKSLAISFGVLILLAILFFYVYLPSTTNHGEQMVVPDFRGLPSERLDSVIAAAGLRYEINDSSYSDEFGPLEVSRQFPQAGSKVKPNRKIFISINRRDPPTVPLPALADLSLIGAQAILVNNHLKPGMVIYKSGPFPDLVLSMEINGLEVKEGTRVPKGTIINLVVGNGAGRKDFIVHNLVGISLKKAMLLIPTWNLNLGKVEVGPDADTTGVMSYVYKQSPAAGDSVRVGDPINIWIGPKGYIPPSDSIDGEQPPF